MLDTGQFDGTIEEATLDLAQLDIGATGLVAGKATFSGGYRPTLVEVRADGELTVTTLTVGEWSIATGEAQASQVAITIRGDTLEADGVAMATLRDIVAGERALGTLVVDGRGSGDNVEARLAWTIDETTKADARLSAKKVGAGWSGDIAAIDIHAYGNRLTQSKPTEWRIAGEQIDLSELCLAAPYGSTVCATGQSSGDRWDASWRLDDLKFERPANAARHHRIHARGRWPGGLRPAAVRQRRPRHPGCRTGTRRARPGGA